MIQATTESAPKTQESPKKGKRNSAAKRSSRSRSSRSKGQVSVENAFQRELLDMKDAQAQSARFLEKAAEISGPRGLSQLLTDLETRTASIQRSLDRVLKAHGVRKSPSACKPVRAMLQEASKVRWSAETGLEGSLLLITSLQKVLHYGIASFGSLRAWSILMRDEDAEVLCAHVTDDLKDFDRDLSQVAYRSLEHGSSETTA
jgi:ferritin-like metal-binding protein YciE